MKNVSTIKGEGKEEKKPFCVSVVVKSVPLDKLRFSIDSLLNTAKKLQLVSAPTVDELKFGQDTPHSSVQYEFDLAAVGAMRGLLGPDEYKFVLSRTSTVTSGTGTLTINTSLNLTQYNEGAALIALFDECAMIKGTILFQPGTTGGQNSFSELIGFYPSEDAGTPTAAIVSRLRHSTAIYNGSYPLDQKPQLIWTTPKRLWGFTIDEGVASPRIISGFNGTLKMIVLAGTPSNSNPYFGYLAKVIGKFRSRT